MRERGSREKKPPGQLWTAFEDVISREKGNNNTSSYFGENQFLGALLDYLVLTAYVC